MVFFLFSNRQFVGRTQTAKRNSQKQTDLCALHIHSSWNLFSRRTARSDLFARIRRVRQRRTGSRACGQRNAVKHSAKEEAVMKQLIQQLGPKTKLAKLTMANWKAEKAARLVKPSAGSGSTIVRIPLDQLEDSPYQLRQDMDSDALAELVRSIRDHGCSTPSWSAAARRFTRSSPGTGGSPPI